MSGAGAQWEVAGWPERDETAAGWCGGVGHCKD